jgi:hypothetical protein
MTAAFSNYLQARNLSIPGLSFVMFGFESLRVLQCAMSIKVSKEEMRKSMPRYAREGKSRL